MNRSKIQSIATFLLAGLVTGLVIGCGGSTRSTVDGYADLDLNEKRIFLLLPGEGEIIMQNPDAYAYSRGIAESNVGSYIFSEFQTRMTDALDARYDSNTVLNYSKQSVAALYPLEATKDFSATGSVDWTTVDRARKEGAIDYLLVFNSITIQNEKPKGDQGRGREIITASYTLIDPATKKNMASGIAKINVTDPRVPNDSYVLLAREVASELPFYNRNF